MKRTVDLNKRTQTITLLEENNDLELGKKTPLKHNIKNKKHGNDSLGCVKIKKQKRLHFGTLGAGTTWTGRSWV